MAARRSVTRRPTIVRKPSMMLLDLETEVRIRLILTLLQA
jgi:hypothetical protein